MLREAMALEDSNTGFLTLLLDKRTPPLSALTTPDLATLFGDPDAMEVDRPWRLGAMAGVTHAPESTKNLLKLPPQGGGFAPPNGRQ
jgi:hypothetical protein